MGWEADDITTKFYDNDAYLTLPPQWGRVMFDPDAMDLDGIGAAHSTRGRVVRAFFWLMRLWP